MSGLTVRLGAGGDPVTSLTPVRGATQEAGVSEGLHRAARLPHPPLWSSPALPGWPDSEQPPGPRRRPTGREGRCGQAVEHSLVTTAVVAGPGIRSVPAPAQEPGVGRWGVPGLSLACGPHSGSPGLRHVRNCFGVLQACGAVVRRRAIDRERWLVWAPTPCRKLAQRGHSGASVTLQSVSPTPFVRRTPKGWRVPNTGSWGPRGLAAEGLGQAGELAWDPHVPLMPGVSACRRGVM